MGDAPAPRMGERDEGLKLTKGLIALLCAIVLTSVSVSAHSGKTDACGGHWNNGTGGYHYHHGYPAHSHINGECPYNFDDRTGWNSSDEMTSESSPYSDAIAGSENNEEKEAERSSFILLILVCIFLLAPLALLLISLIIGIVWAIKDKLVDAPKRKKEKEEEKRRMEIQLENERTEFMSNYGGKRLGEIAPPPMKGDHIGEDGLPCGAGNSQWGRYTVYVTPHGKAFHTKKVCGAACGQAVNLASVRYIKQPCSRCGRGVPDLRWYDEQKRLLGESKRLFGGSVFADEGNTDFLPEVPKPEMRPNVQKRLKQDRKHTAEADFYREMCGGRSIWEMAEYRREFILIAMTSHIHLTAHHKMTRFSFMS